MLISDFFNKINHDDDFYINLSQEELINHIYSIDYNLYETLEELPNKQHRNFFFIKQHRVVFELIIHYDSLKEFMPIQEHVYNALLNGFKEYGYFTYYRNNIDSIIESSLEFFPGEPVYKFDISKFFEQAEIISAKPTKQEIIRKKKTGHKKDIRLAKKDDKLRKKFGLSKSDYLVLKFMYRSFISGKRRAIKIAQETLARNLKCSIRQIVRILKKLKALNLIHFISARFQRESNTYYPTKKGTLFDRETFDYIGHHKKNNTFQKCHTNKRIIKDNSFIYTKELKNFNFKELFFIKNVKNKLNGLKEVWDYLDNLKFSPFVDIKNKLETENISCNTDNEIKTLKYLYKKCFSYYDYNRNKIKYIRKQPLDIFIDFVKNGIKNNLFISWDKAQKIGIERKKLRGNNENIA